MALRLLLETHEFDCVFTLPRKRGKASIDEQAKAKDMAALEALMLSVHNSSEVKASVVSGNLKPQGPFVGYDTRSETDATVLRSQPEGLRLPSVPICHCSLPQGPKGGPGQP